MVEVIQKDPNLKEVSALANNLSIEDKILITLEYLRQGRSYFHIAIDWGMEESTTARIIQKIENILRKSEAFNLPNKKKLRNWSIKKY